MKTIKLKHIEELNGKSIVDVSHYFDNQSVYQYIDVIGWPDRFPYKPDCKFKIGRSKDKLYIKYYIKEKNIKALYSKDMSPVCKDSCVEFFCKLPEQKSYYNFEFNCIGTCLANKREGRTQNVNPLNESQLLQIERYPSLEKQTFEEKQGSFEWELTVAIPLKLIEAENADKIYANFYKCGDETKEPHYLSWNPIETDNPDFHRPEFFGTVEFEK